MTIFFQMLARSTQIGHFWSQMLAFSLLNEILQLDKFEEACFK